eukprot:1908137-Alexandrium_andersonii.AAC.1
MAASTPHHENLSDVLPGAALRMGFTQATRVQLAACTVKLPVCRRLVAACGAPRSERALAGRCEFQCTSKRNRMAS